MRIRHSDRVVYEINPLAEVICQLRFQPTEFSDAVLELFTTGMRDLGFFEVNVDRPSSISLSLEDGHLADFKRAVGAPVHNFFAADRTLQVSLSAEFIALVCTSYTEWREFKNIFLNVSILLNKIMDIPDAVRIGLRYKDVIDRQALGLGDVPWHELLNPFVIGPLGAAELAADGFPPEESVQGFVFQANMILDECKLLLQSALLSSPEQEASGFVIDADFYRDQGIPPKCFVEHAVLESALEALHSNAGPLFRSAIKGKLHDALRPRS